MISVHSDPILSLQAEAEGAKLYQLSSWLQAVGLNHAAGAHDETAGTARA